jgi:hypothetical protein
MKGDFSSWRDERRRNFNGVLHQQGRVLLDADWNAQTAINNDWQDTAAEDIIGAGVAAVPSDKPNGFKVTSAIHSLGDNNVQLKVTPGRVWADGLLAQLYGEPDPDSSSDVTRVATYLKPPVQDPAFDESTINTNVRDAVVLEVWREEINGFQIPETLIEPALGGPDTTERVHTAMAFRLMRLGPNDTCENIRGRLQDDFSKKGKLKVTLKPTNPGSGDCPVVAGGGYTGFEHNIYRIEIANVKSGPPQFKWSQYAGGLVGRGHFDNAKKEVTIKANLQAITNSGLTSFYVEAVEYDTDLGHWRVTYGANATLNNNILSLGVENFGAIPNNPQPTDTTFFRLWNGVALVQDFANTELPNNVGINLDFEAPAASNYVPGDYWTFPVRAGEIANNEILIDKKAPQGIHYHRVPLAVLSWADTQNTLLPIEDCRHIFHPLTRLATCCSYRVGDGMQSWGDFDKIQDAIDNLPAGGGEICILPGEYEENVVIKNRQNITLKGCGVRSRVVTATDANAGASDPVIHIYESQNIKVESLGIFAHKKGVGVQLEGPDMQGLQGGTLRDITLNKLYIEAATRCAIQCHIGFAVTIQGCDIEMSDEPSDAVGIFLTGDDCFIKENIVRVISARVKGVGISGGRTLDTNLFEPAVAGRGGIQIGGTSERVLISHNLIQGGISHGIILGSLLKVEDGGGSTTDIPGEDGVIDECDPCHDTNTHEEDDENSTTTTISAGALYDIYIKHNLIYNMGANGISVINFFDLEKKDEFITVERLTIGNNEIRNCLRRNIQEIPQKMLNSMGYGGIALADVEYLVIHDNLIENNGPSHIMPICGIYVLHGEGIEISRNRIINNGANDGQPAEGAHSGARGGIYINYAIAPRVPFLPQMDIIPVQNGVPAFRAHDNIVSAPLGQALFLVALGPVSVVGNQFTTLGVLGMRNFSLSWIATTVLIFNLGLSNELYFQLLAFWVVALGQIKSKDKYVLDGDTLVSPKEGLDDQNLGQYLANGNVLFSDNQVTLNLMDKFQEFALSSILIASLDDVSFHGNQCDCDLYFGDFIFTHSIVFGISVRVEDNRFKEGILGAWLSAITLGLLNMTTDNQSTHCLMILGWKVVNSPNSVLLDAFYRDDACGAFRGIGSDFGQKPGQTQSGQSTPAGGANPTVNTNTINANQAYTVRAYK